MKVAFSLSGSVHPAVPSDNRGVLEDLPVPEATPHAAGGQGNDQLTLQQNCFETWVGLTWILGAPLSAQFCLD